VRRTIRGQSTPSKSKGFVSVFHFCFPCAFLNSFARVVDTHDCTYSYCRRWYPGCLFVQRNKGLDFIQTARSRLDEKEAKTADSLTYNKDNVDFLGKKFVGLLSFFVVRPYPLSG